MNGFLMTANILTMLAFLIHAFGGDAEICKIRPRNFGEESEADLQMWVMSRCGWHWISIDLLIASVVMSLINFTSILPQEMFLIKILAFCFSAYAVVWLLGILISPKFQMSFLKLGQWLLLAVIAVLLYLGV